MLSGTNFHSIRLEDSGLEHTEIKEEIDEDKIKNEVYIVDNSLVKVEAENVDFKVDDLYVSHNYSLESCKKYEVDDFYESELPDKCCKNFVGDINELGQTEGLLKIAKRRISHTEELCPNRGETKLHYYEVEKPNQDIKVFCNNCGEEYVDFCTKCGMLIALHDSPVPMGTRDRARKTAPKGVLEVRPSSVNRFGVFTLKHIGNGVQMGPYQGNVIKMNKRNGYSWKWQNGFLFDTGDETVSNWMRYVNCAKNTEEQNLVVFQHKAALYYRTCREIEKDEELLVYYGPSLDKKKHFKPDVEEIDKVHFVCTYCRIGLSTREYRDTHQARCKYMKESAVYALDDNHTCKHCFYLSTTTKEPVKQQECPKKREEAQKSEKDVKMKAAHKEFQCVYCPYRSKKEGFLREHVSKTHKKEDAELWRCEKCKYKTFHREHLDRHLSVHLKHEPLSCLKCSRLFNRKLELDNHYLKHHDEYHYLITHKVHQCEHCDYKSIRVADVASHVNARHSGETAKTHSCDLCGFTSSWKRNVQRHLLTVHSSNGKQHTCAPCGKGFDQKRELDCHVLSNHSRNEPLLGTITHKIHECQLCGYKTIKMWHLKKHMRTHNRKE